MDRRTFLVGLGAVAAAPVLPALAHGEYAGEGVIGEWVPARAIVMSGLYPYQKTVVSLIEAGALAYGRPNYAGFALSGLQHGLRAGHVVFHARGRGAGGRDAGSVSA